MLLKEVSRLMDLEQLERRLALEWLRVKDDARYVRALLSERRFGEVLQASWRRIMGFFGRKTAPQLGRQIVEDPLRYFVVLARPALTALQLAPLPEVSIVIPVFNGKEYVRQCIESIYSSRTETSFEVIVVDQHSSDGSREYLRKVAHQHAKFQTHRKFSQRRFSSGHQPGRWRRAGRIPGDC